MPEGAYASKVSITPRLPARPCTWRKEKSRSVERFTSTPASGSFAEEDARSSSSSSCLRCVSNLRGKPGLVNPRSGRSCVDGTGHHVQCSKRQENLCTSPRKHCNILNRLSPHPNRGPQGVSPGCWPSPVQGEGASSTDSRIMGFYVRGML